MPYFCWIAKPGQTARAVTNLERQRFDDVYVPRYKTKDGRINFLFGRYGFVDVARDADWRPLLSTWGVAGVVQFAGCPARVPQSLLDALKAAELSGALDERQPESRLKPGAAVRVGTGALAVNGVFMKMRSSQRASVLIRLLSGDCVANVGLDNLVLV